MKIKALAPWFGGKRTLAPEIVELLGPHTQYFEPFAGSLAVLFAKQPSQKETVNDLHGDIVNLARVVQFEASAVQLYDRLQRALFCEELLEQARLQLDDESGLSLIAHHLGDRPLHHAAIDRAYWFFLASWMGRNGTAGTARVDYQVAVRWTSNGGSPTTRFTNALESLPAWHRRLQNVVILCRDAFNILDRFEDSPKTAIYCDPPYLPESRTGLTSGKGSSSRYKHEFDSGTCLWDDDHARLASVLGDYKRASIVVSYYDCPRARELYPKAKGWRFIDHARQKHLHAQNKRGAAKQEAPEVLIVNSSASSAPLR